MPAKQKPCDYCGALFWASRSDARFCRRLCCNRSIREDSRFEFPYIPQSGVPGVTFDRYKKRWIVKVKGEFFDSFSDLALAKEFRSRLQT